MWQHFESVCHPSGEQGEADHGRLFFFQCALRQFLGSFSFYDALWRQRRRSSRHNAPSLRLQQRRTQQIDDMKGFPGPKLWSRLGSLCSSTPFLCIGFLQENGSLGSPLRTQMVQKKQRMNGKFLPLQPSRTNSPLQPLVSSSAPSSFHQPSWRRLMREVYRHPPLNRTVCPSSAVPERPNLLLGHWPPRFYCLQYRRHPVGRPSKPPSFSQQQVSSASFLRLTYMYSL